MGISYIEYLFMQFSHLKSLFTTNSSDKFGHLNYVYYVENNTFAECFFCYAKITILYNYKCAFH